MTSWLTGQPFYLSQDMCIIVVLMSLNDSSLIALVQKAKGGDSAAFDDLYRQFMTPIFRFVFIRVRNRADAEDLTQTVFVKAWNALPRFDDREERFLAWLYTIARNSIIDHWKKKKDIVFDETNSIFTQFKSDEDPSKDVDRMFTQDQIQQLLDEIDIKHSEILYLKFIEQLENKEIAELLGKKENAIRQMQCRALKAVRKHMYKKNLSTFESSLL